MKPFTLDVAANGAHSFVVTFLHRDLAAAPITLCLIDRQLPVVSVGMVGSVMQLETFVGMLELLTRTLSVLVLNLETMTLQQQVRCVRDAVREAGISNA